MNGSRSTHIIDRYNKIDWINKRFYELWLQVETSWIKLRRWYLGCGKNYLTVTYLKYTNIEALTRYPQYLKLHFRTHISFWDTAKTSFEMQRRWYHHSVGTCHVWYSGTNKFANGRSKFRCDSDDINELANDQERIFCKLRPKVPWFTFSNQTQFWLR